MPMLPSLKPKVHQLVWILLGCFVQAEPIQGANNDIVNTNFKDPPDDQLDFGQEVEL